MQGFKQNINEALLTNTLCFFFLIPLLNSFVELYRIFLLSLNCKNFSLIIFLLIGFLTSKLCKKHFYSCETGVFFIKISHGAHFLLVILVSFSGMTEMTYINFIIALSSHTCLSIFSQLVYMRSKL